MYESFKEFREERFNNFIENWLPELIGVYSVYENDNGSFSIHVDKYGIIDYFPKANKLLIRKQNKWVKPGLRWIIKNLIDKNKLA